MKASDFNSSEEYQEHLAYLREVEKSNGVNKTTEKVSGPGFWYKFANFDYNIRQVPAYRLFLAVVHFFIFYLIAQVDGWGLHEEILPWFSEFTYDFKTISIFAGITFLIISNFVKGFWRFAGVMSLIMVELIWGFNSEDGAYSASWLVQALMGLAGLISFARGSYFLWTMSSGTPTIEGMPISLQDGFIQLVDGLLEPRNPFEAPESSGGHNGNLERALEYRDGKLGTMTQSQGAELLRDTASLDVAYQASLGGHSNTRAASNYYNDKLGTMSNEKGLNYSRGKK